jgi:hypothetical protein
MSKEKQIFISHSGKDKSIIDDFIDLILHGALSVPIDKIFCTSTDGTKIKSGDDWRNSILQALTTAKINFLIITPNYKESEICMNEMGAVWVAKAKVIPLIIEPINYKTVGVIQEPIQIEKLTDEKSLDRIKDIVQKELSISNDLIKSDRWTSKKKEFVYKLKEYLKNNVFEVPMDRTEFNSLLQEKEELENAITNIIQEKATLEKMVEELKKAKNKSDVKKITKKYSNESDFEEFEELCQSANNLISNFHPIIIGIIFKTYANKDLTINWQSYKGPIDEALANDYIIEELDADFHTTSKMMKIELALDNISSFLSKDLTEDFHEQYESQYEAPQSLTNKLFWEEVLDLTIYIE